MLGLFSEKAGVLPGTLPQFDGAGIPDSPEQSAPWQVGKTKLPPDAVSAITDIFKMGLADPRGCEYREIEVVIVSCWGDSGVMKTHGWVLPSPEKERRRGLERPDLSSRFAGGPAGSARRCPGDAEKDAAEIAKTRAHFDQSERQSKDAAEREGKKYHRTDWPLRWDMNVVPEGESIATDSMRPVKAASLLRLGETGWAERVLVTMVRARLQGWAKAPHIQLASHWVQGSWIVPSAPICGATTVRRWRPRGNWSLFTRPMRRRWPRAVPLIRKIISTFYRAQTR